MHLFGDLLHVEDGPTQGELDCFHGVLFTGEGRPFLG
jgi:hypothetical protein